MSDKEKKLRIMDIASDIAHHAADTAYVRTRANDLVAELFCDCIREGAKAYLCVTGEGPAYTIDTDFGSFTVPYISVNEKLMNGTNSITGNARPGLASPSEDEKKKNIVEIPATTALGMALIDEASIPNAAERAGTFSENDSCDNASQEHILSLDKETKMNDSALCEDDNSLATHNDADIEINNPGEIEDSINVEVTENIVEEKVSADANPVRTPQENQEDHDSVGEGSFKSNVEMMEVKNDKSENLDDSASFTKSDSGMEETNIEEAFADLTVDDKTSADDIVENLDAIEEDANSDIEHEEYNEPATIENATNPNVIHEAKTRIEDCAIDTERNQTAVHVDAASKTNDKKQIESAAISVPSTEAVTEEKSVESRHGFRSNISVQADVPVKKIGKYNAIDQNAAVETPHVFAYANDHGQIFKHTHNVSVTLKYGYNTKETKYKVEFWPTWVQVDSRARTYADCLVRISDEEGNEKIDMIDRQNSEFTYQFPGTEHKFKMVGAWNSGVLSTVVQLVNDAKFTTKTTVQKEEPEVLDTNFLNQFKVEAKGQPKYFIVPLRADNRGEERIPIIGIAEEPGHTKFILSRMPKNTCQHPFNNRTRIISGHWENGLFHISIS